MSGPDIRNHTQYETVLLGLNLSERPDVAESLAERVEFHPNLFGDKALPHSDQFLTPAEKDAVLQGLAKIIKQPYMPAFRQAIARGLTKQILS